jgi:hypothetical protein
MRTDTKENRPNLRILIPRSVKAEAALGVIEKPKVLPSFGDGDDVLNTNRKQCIRNEMV